MDLAALMKGLEDEVSERVDMVDLAIAFSPVMPFLDRPEAAEVEIDPVCDFTVGMEPPDIGEVSLIVRILHPEFPDPLPDAMIKQLPRMRARWLCLKDRVHDAWEDLDLPAQAAMDALFFGGHGPGPRILPRGVNHVSFKREGGLIHCPTCGGTAPDPGNGGMFTDDGMTAMTQFVAKHSRCGTGEPSPLPADFGLTVRPMIPAAFPPQQPRTPPLRNWIVLAWDGKSSRGEQPLASGTEEKARAAFDKASAKLRRGYVKLVDPDGTVQDRKNAGDPA